MGTPSASDFQDHGNHDGLALEALIDEAAHRAAHPRAEQLAVQDFRTYKVTTLVLPIDHPRAEQVRSLVDLLVGPGKRIDDVWVWDVREFVARG